MDIEPGNMRDRAVVRGVELPLGMTRECFEALRSLFNDRADEADQRTNGEFAICAFEVLKRYNLQP